MVGFALGASQVGGRPIMEFQFADFSTEAATQLGLNAGHLVSSAAGQPAPLLLRLPCGGGLTLGAFHSGEFEGLWSRFPGLKLLYPATPRRRSRRCWPAFTTAIPAWCSSTSCSTGARAATSISTATWRRSGGRGATRKGPTLTLVAFGAMVHEALAAADRSPADRSKCGTPACCSRWTWIRSSSRWARRGGCWWCRSAGETQGLGDRIISLGVPRGLAAS